MSIAAMVASIKFNDRRNKREAFNHISGNTDTQSRGIKIEPVSEETLQEIRDKLKRQRKVLFRKRVVSFVAILILIVSAFVFVLY